jgi:hypothetical protein
LRRGNEMVYSMSRELADRANPIELDYSSRVIWRLSLVRRFLIEIRCSSSIRRYIRTSFLLQVNCRPRSNKRGFAHLEPGPKSRKLRFCNIGSSNRILARKGM